MTLTEEITRIHQYQSEPGKAPPNEPCTCEWIIVPLLWKLGYAHHEIFSQVADDAGKFPDYTILPHTPQTWYLEAKAWKEDLQHKHVIQAMNYAHTTGRRWVVLSNGREWRLYDDHILEVENRLVAQARLGKENDCALAELLAALGKASVESGKIESYAMKARLAAILNEQLPKHDSELIEAMVSTLKNKYGLAGLQNAEVAAYFQQQTPPTPPITDDTTPPPPPSVSALTIPELRALGGKLTGKPKKLTTPNGTEIVVDTWRDVAEQIVRYFGGKNQLPPLPYQGGSTGKRCFLNTMPRHLDGKEMLQPRELLIAGKTLYLCTNRSAADFVARLEDLCLVAGEAASGFSVQR